MSLSERERESSNTPRRLNTNLALPCLASWMMDNSLLLLVVVVVVAGVSWMAIHPEKRVKSSELISKVFEISIIFHGSVFIMVYL